LTRKEKNNALKRNDNIIQTDNAFVHEVCNKLKSIIAAKLIGRNITYLRVPLAWLPHYIKSN